MDMIYKDSRSQIFEDLAKTLKKAAISDLHNYLNNYYDNLSNRFIAHMDKMILSFTNIIYAATENKIKELLSQTNEEEDVSIRLFEGISVDCMYIPEREKTNNFNGEVIIYPPYIKPKFSVSRNYIKTLNRIT